MSSQTVLPGIRATKPRAHGPDTPIPDKLYFKIGEVSQLVGVRAHVLRYWEKEVPSIRPGKSASNQRRYRYRDVEIFREIRRLLHQERYTLAGAKKRIMAGERGEPLPPPELEPLASDASARDDLAMTYAFAPSPLREPAATALPLGFNAAGVSHERLERVRQGLRALIRRAGEEP